MAWADDVTSAQHEKCDPCHVFGPPQSLVAAFCPEAVAVAWADDVTSAQHGKLDAYLRFYGKVRCSIRTKVTLRQGFQQSIGCSLPVSTVHQESLVAASYPQAVAMAWADDVTSAQHEKSDPCHVFGPPQSLVAAFCPEAVAVAWADDVTSAQHGKLDAYLRFYG